jgi:HK97 family phage portal protein
VIIETKRGDVVRVAKPRNPWGAYDSLASSTYSGQTITPESALALPAIMGAVALVSEHNGVMPLETIDMRATSGRRLVEGGWLAPMLRFAPNEDQSGADLWTMVNAHLMLRGNAYLAKVRDPRGLISELYPLHPANVNPYRAENGEKRFRIRVYDGLDFTEIDATPEAVLHIKGKSINNPLVGESVIAHARHSLGTHAAQIEYQARTYQDGMLIKGVLSTPERNLNPEAVQRVKAQWQSTYQGVANSHDIAVLHSGITFQQVSMSPQDAQFIEAMQWSHTQVATMFKIPASRLNGDGGASMRYANMREDDLFFDKQACLPIRVMIEQSLNRDLDLFGATSPWVPKFNEAAQLRADIQTRFSVYEKGRALGVFSANDIRRAEDLPELGEQGDDYTPLRSSGSVGGRNVEDAERALRDSRTLPDQHLHVSVNPAEHRTDVHVSVPEQDPPVVNVAAPEVREMPAPIVNVSSPDVVVNVPEQPAPVVNVDVAAPQVDVAAPSVSVAAPDVRVEPVLSMPAVDGGKSVTIRRDANGYITGASVDPSGS